MFAYVPVSEFRRTPPPPLLSALCGHTYSRLDVILNTACGQIQYDGRRQSGNGEITTFRLQSSLRFLIWNLKRALGLGQPLICVCLSKFGTVRTTHLREQLSTNLPSPSSPPATNGPVICVESSISQHCTVRFCGNWYVGALRASGDRDESRGLAGGRLRVTLHR